MIELQLVLWLVTNCPFQDTKQCIIKDALNCLIVQEVVKVLISSSSEYLDLESAAAFSWGLRDRLVA